MRTRIDKQVAEQLAAQMGVKLGTVLMWRDGPRADCHPVSASMAARLAEAFAAMKLSPEPLPSPVEPSVRSERKALKKGAAVAALADPELAKLSDTELAKRLGCGHSTVARVRKRNTRSRPRAPTIDAYDESEDLEELKEDLLVLYDSLSKMTAGELACVRFLLAQAPKPEKENDDGKP